MYMFSMTNCPGETIIQSWSSLTHMIDSLKMLHLLRLFPAGTLAPNKARGSASKWRFQAMLYSIHAPHIWLWYWLHSECPSNEIWLSTLFLKQCSPAAVLPHLEGKVPIPLGTVHHLGVVSKVVVTPSCRSHKPTMHKSTICYFAHAVFLYILFPLVILLCQTADLWGCTVRSSVRMHDPFFLGVTQLSLVSPSHWKSSVMKENMTSDKDLECLQYEWKQYFKLAEWNEQVSIASY